MTFHSKTICAFFIAGIGVACAPPKPDAPPPVIHARFDPGARVIPMPSDVLRDDDAGRLALDATAVDLTPAERELYQFLNTRDGWSTASQATVEFDARVRPSSVNEETVQVFLWTEGVATPIEGRPRVLDDDGRVLAIDAPEEGWPRGATVQVVVRGGAGGVRGAGDERVECDAAFYFLRLTEPLTDPAHERAFPGATREERRAAAEKLEALRLELAPYFDFLAARGIPREEVAAMWTFTLTRSTELAMDKASQRMPLPIDLVRDPETGLIDLPVHASDSELEAEIKHSLRIYDGFGTTMPVGFTFTGPVDPDTLTPETVKLYELADPPLEIPATIVVSDDRRRVQVVPQQVPLLPGTLHGIVLRDGILDADGLPIVPMTPGHFLRATHPIARDGRSLVAAVADADAVRLEAVRAELAPALDRLGREGVAIGWPWTTLTVAGPLVRAQKAAETLGVPVDPEDVTSMSPLEAALDFPMGALTLWRVKEVFHGSIVTPDHLDPLTRARREDGGAEPRRIRFTLTIPDSAKAGEPVPVVLFGHGLMTERRFVLAVADALAAKGYAAIAVDFPYHGERTVCAWNGPNCFPAPWSADGEMICPAPCQSGSTCSQDGACRDASGNETALTRWPIVPMYQSSGAAFIEVDHIASTRDHFLQAVTDLGALSRSLRLGDWESATGYRLDGGELRYMGQSLGGILGGLYVPLDPHVTRAVLNVPGGNLVGMFTDSALFSLHIEAFLERNGIEPGSADHDRFLSIAHWMVDPVDPVNVARHLTGPPIPEAGGPVAPREIFIQMALLDFIIPNSATEQLQSAAGVPRKDYLAEHGFITIPVEPAYPFGVSDAAGFLEGTWAP